MAFVKVAVVSELTPGQGKLVVVAGKQLALFLTEGKLFAIDEICPHRGAPMHEGYCEGSQVTCPWHNASFDLATGKHLSPPAKSGVQSYPVRLNGDDVEIEVA